MRVGSVQPLTGAPQVPPADAEVQRNAETHNRVCRDLVMSHAKTARDGYVTCLNREQRLVAFPQHPLLQP